MNHAFCGPMYAFYQSTLSSVSPAPSWGGRARFNFTQQAYVEFGGYAVDNKTVLASTNIFNWGTGGVTGTNYLVEIGYEAHFSNEQVPHYYRIGVSYEDAPRSDAFLNTDGLAFYKYGGTKLTHTGETAVYATGGQLIWRPDKSSRRNVAVFGSIYYNFSDSEAIQYAVKAGVVKTGTFATRSRDTVGFGISPVAFTAKEVALLTGLRAKSGGEGQVPGHEVILELNYGYELAPGVVLRPNLQYLVYPDPRYTPTHATDIPNSFVIGLQVNANLDALFTLPHD